LNNSILHCKEKGRIEVDFPTWVTLGEITLHREDGPAVEHKHGSGEWYLNGKRHREDGPAIEYTSGAREWYLNGKLHRIDGPAIERVNSTHRSWYVEGKELNIIPKYILVNYMKANNLTLAHLLTDPDPLVRKSTTKYKWKEAI
jgi:hypothetical protein